MVWAVSLSTVKLIPHSLTRLQKVFLVFLVCHNLVPLSQPAPKQCFTPRQIIVFGCASTHFGENQLAPSSICISQQITAHLPVFQHWSVRTSNWCYPNFILAMIRSPGFGSSRTNNMYFYTCFHLGSPKEFG